MVEARVVASGGLTRSQSFTSRRLITASHLSAENLQAVHDEITELMVGRIFKTSNQWPFAEVGLHHKSFGALVPCAQVLMSAINTRAALPSNLPICAADPCRLENVGAPPLFPSRGKLEKSFQ